LARRPINKKSAARKARSPVIEQVIAKSGAGAGHKMKPAVILVGADKGGVGKTTVARALADYLTGKNILTRAFDTESPRGTLKRFYGDMTEVVDIDSTSDQMKILDTLNTAQVKVSIIDTRASALARTLRSLRNVGFFDAVRDGQFTFILFHVLGRSIASLDEIAETAPFVANADYFLVKNHVNDSTFFEWDPTTYQTYFSKTRSADELTIPKLVEMAYEQVEIAGTLFSTFVANKTSDGRAAGHSFVLRGYVRT
jgi:DNA polymerase III delta prime subunit